MSPALAGRFFTTEPPGKPQSRGRHTFFSRGQMILSQPLNFIEPESNHRQSVNKCIFVPPKKSLTDTEI